MAPFPLRSRNLDRILILILFKIPGKRRKAWYQRNVSTSPWPPPCLRANFVPAHSISSKHIHMTYRQHNIYINIAYSLSAVLCANNVCLFGSKRRINPCGLLASDGIILNMMKIEKVKIYKIK